jgi:hypothetical protein
MWQLFGERTDEIIIELDGDDWLYNDKVLGFINDKYEKNKNTSSESCMTHFELNGGTMTN